MKYLKQNNMFKKAEIGDRVYDLLKGWGTIVNINPEDNYPIYVNSDADSFCTFTYDGKRDINDKNPTLFWRKISLNNYIKKKSKNYFSLETALRKLQVCDFKDNGEANYFLSWNRDKNKIQIEYTHTHCFPTMVYFTQDSVVEFMKSIQGRKINKKFFIRVYMELYNYVWEV